jgi:glycosyltransferase involved in cell wall biosynthesis
MLTADRVNEYVLLYDDPERLGTYAGFPNVTEVAVRCPSKLLWDQIVVPWLARRHGVDVIFNLKMSIPLLAPCSTMYVQHGADWFVVPEQYPFLDQLYVRLFSRLYWQRADRIISVSADATRRLAALMGAKNAAKLVTIHHGVDSQFSAPRNPQALAGLRDRYGLRAPFVLYLGQIYPMKNVGRLIRAFARLGKRVPHELILVGKVSPRSASELALIGELGLGSRVRCIGWVPSDEVPLFYQAAELFAFPSLYEGFGIPIIEAMAAGCPVVTSTAGACPEVAGDAALLVDPLDVDAIAENIFRGLTDAQLRTTLRERGRARAKAFDWDVAARRTIEVVEDLAGSPASRTAGRQRRARHAVTLECEKPAEASARAPTSGGAP